MGLLRDLITTVIQNWGLLGLRHLVDVCASGLNVLGALFLLLVVGGITYWRYADPAQAPSSSKA